VAFPRVSTVTMTVHNWKVIDDSGGSRLMAVAEFQASASAPVRSFVRATTLPQLRFSHVTREVWLRAAPGRCWKVDTVNTVFFLSCAWPPPCRSVACGVVTVQCRSKWHLTWFEKNAHTARTNRLNRNAVVLWVK
jgi:hypothetical protein